MNHTSKLYTLEGTGGSGKTTTLQEIATFFQSQGIPYIATREIGGNFFCEELRKLSYDPSLDNMTLLLITLAARVEHINKVIKPALAAGKSVICDRFSDSTHVYQGVFHGIPSSVIETFEINSGIAYFKPDYTFLLDAPTKVIHKRISARNRGCRYDKISRKQIDVIRAAYLKRAAKEKGRFIVFNTEYEHSSLALIDTLKQIIKE